MCFEFVRVVCDTSSSQTATTTTTATLGVALARTMGLLWHGTHQQYALDLFQSTPPNNVPSNSIGDSLIDVMATASRLACVGYVMNFHSVIQTTILPFVQIGERLRGDFGAQSRRRERVRHLGLRRLLRSQASASKPFG